MTVELVFPSELPSGFSGTYFEHHGAAMTPFARQVLEDYAKQVPMTLDIGTEVRPQAVRTKCISIKLDPD